MDFGLALAALKAGKRVSREAWAQHGTHLMLIGRIKLTIGDKHYDQVGYIAVSSALNFAAPWLKPDMDIFAEDWFVVDDDAQAKAEGTA